MPSVQALINNVRTWISAIAVSAGIADASKVPLTNSSGILDNSFVNWASPGAIGATTANTIRGTTLTATSTTGSTSSTTGAQIVGGGLGVAENINAGGTSHKFGADANGSAVLAINGAAGTLRQLVFQTASLPRWNLYLNTGTESGSDANGALSLNYYSDAGVSKGTVLTFFRNTGSITVNKYVDLQTIGVAGTASFTSTTDSSSSTSGAVTFGGGVGITKNLNVGGNFAVTGTLKVGSGGSTITRVLLASSSALDTISVAAQSSTTITVTVTGAQVGDQVDVNKASAAPNNAFILDAYVSATNTVTVVAYNRNTVTTQVFSGNVKVLVVG